MRTPAFCTGRSLDRFRFCSGRLLRRAPFGFTNFAFRFFEVPGIVKIGILAVQGDFAAHAVTLQSLGADTVEVRTVHDLESCDGLILPGGESTTQLQFLREEGLYD